MTTNYPPKVKLSDGVSGTFSLIRKAARDPSTAIPAELLTTPILSGRRIWKWCSVSGPDEVEHVLAANGANYPRSKVVHSVMGPALRHSLFSADMHTHKWHRRTAMKMYTTKRSIANVPFFKELVAYEAQALPDTKLRFDAAVFVENITLRVSLWTTCATYEPDNLIELRRAMDAFSDATLRITPSDMFKLPIILSTRLKMRGIGSLNALQQDLSVQIDNRVAGLAAPADDLLQHLLGARDPATGNKMSKREVLGNLTMMAVAAHEPTASALSWAIYLLATHPEAQDRAREEVMAVLNNTSKQADSEMPFLTAVMEETMRLYPVVPILLRDTLNADEVGGCPVDAGSFMIVPVYAMHRSPVHWFEPDKFIPDRFLSGGVPRRAFLPFSTGARSCIGRMFAMTEMQVVLSEFLLRFRFSATPGKVPKPQTLMSLRPKGGVWIDAERL